jgi:putative transcriptional regulator
MLFEDIIRGIRLQLNMTQEQLARELNISFSTINRWENVFSSIRKYRE